MADAQVAAEERENYRQRGPFQDMEGDAAMRGRRRPVGQRLAQPFRLLLKAARGVVRRRRGRGGGVPPFSSMSLAMPDPFEDGACGSADDRMDGPSSSGNLPSMALEHYGCSKHARSRSAHFPLVLHKQARQELLTIGSRHWGNWMTGACGISVPIYDFAIHVDSSQVSRQEQVAIGAEGSLALGQGQDLQLRGDVYQQLREAAPEADLSLTIRAARNLPIKLLSEEFERILRRRTVKVGGDPSDPALEEVLRYFSNTRLPRQVLAAGGEAVRTGSTITFTRSAGGQLATWAEDVPLGSVTSPKVCEALFDLYLGDQPVCKKAKLAAGSSLARMMTDVQHAYQPSGLEQIVCPGGSNNEEACYVKLR